MYGDGVHLIVAHKREGSYGFKPDNKAICLSSEEVACRRPSQLDPTKVLNNVSNAFNFIGHSRRAFIDLCDQWLALQVTWLQRGSDCTLTRLTHWALEDVQGQADQQGRVMQGVPSTAR